MRKLLISGAVAILVVAFFYSTASAVVSTDEDIDGVFGSADLCQNTDPDLLVPEGTFILWGENRWHYDGSVLVQTPRKKGSEILPLEYTHGCSCLQILEGLGFQTGENYLGHYKFGCSTGIIENWHYSYTDPGGFAPVDAPANVSATDGAYTDKVTITWDAVADATGYYLWNGNEWIDAGNNLAYDDTNAPGPVINENSTNASEGTFITHVALYSTADVSPGQVVEYKVMAYNSYGDGPESEEENGNRGSEALSFQWQRSSGDADSGYSNLIGANTSSYDDTSAPENGEQRYYRVELSSPGAISVTSSSDPGYRMEVITIAEPSPEDIQEEINNGKILFEGTSSSSANSGIFNTNFAFSSGDQTLLIPESTTITKNGGGNFNLLNFDVEDISDRIVNFNSGMPIRTVRIGNNNDRFNFSQNVTISMLVGSDYEGKTLHVAYRNAGETNWNDFVTCLVQDGICSFETNHATDYTAWSGPIDVNLDILSTISIDCTDSVTMHAITGTGKSQWTGSENDAYCNVKTNNSSGFKMDWQASSANMTSGSDIIGSYTPVTTGVPEVWNIANNASEWGAHLMTTSTDEDQGFWGSADSYAGGNWLNVDTTADEILNRSTETNQLGSEEFIRFGAEIGSDKFQPTGMYQVNVTMTATTN